MKIKIVAIPLLFGVTFLLGVYFPHFILKNNYISIFYFIVLSYFLIHIVEKLSRKEAPDEENDLKEVKIPLGIGGISLPVSITKREAKLLVSVAIAVGCKGLFGHYTLTVYNSVQDECFFKEMAPSSLEVTYSANRVLANYEVKGNLFEVRLPNHYHGDELSLKILHSGCNLKVDTVIRLGHWDFLKKKVKLKYEFNEQAFTKKYKEDFKQIEELLNVAGQEISHNELERIFLSYQEKVRDYKGQIQQKHLEDKVLKDFESEEAYLDQLYYCRLFLLPYLERFDSYQLLLKQDFDDRKKVVRAYKGLSKIVNSFVEKGGVCEEAQRNEFIKEVVFLQKQIEWELGEDI